MSQRLLPRMVQSVEVLQLPAADLDAFLREAFEANEALVLEEPRPVGERRGTREDSDRHDAMLQNHPAPDPGAAEELALQVSMLELAPERDAWLRFLVGCLDERGYLSLPDEELLRLAADEGLEGDVDALSDAIALLQGLEPRGIGARDAIEALLLQLDPTGDDYELLCRLLEEFLDDVAANKLPAVARALQVDVERLHELVDELRELDPRPAAGLGSGGAPVLTPEVVVEPSGDGFRVRVDRSSSSAVAIDPEVRSLAGDASLDGAERKRLRERIDQARWIVQAVESRWDTLHRVATAVFAHQSEFLREGPGHLRPLRMAEVADALGLHPSTVSRAVAGKYAQTPWGIIALRHFFQAGAAASDGGAGAARSDVRDLVAEVVAAEDPAQPLSDDEIAAALAERGHPIARRTVAKYRRELSIPSSYRRRRY